MDKIATKTRIAAWVVVGNREKIDFDLCDFSPDQVAALDRVIRSESDGHLALTIEPEQKKLQIPAITSTVRLVSLSCRTKGQKLKVAEFKSPDERATALKRMSAADTPVILTLEEADAKAGQGKLFGEKTVKSTKRSATESTLGTESKGHVGEGAENGELPSGIAWGDKECQVLADGTIAGPQTVRLALPGLRNAEARIEKALARSGPDPKGKLRWYAGAYLKLGNNVLCQLPSTKDQGYMTLAAALVALGERINTWFGGVPATQAADRKRRDKMRGLVLGQIDEMVHEADQAPAAPEQQK